MQAIGFTAEVPHPYDEAHFEALLSERFATKPRQQVGSILAGQLDGDRRAENQMRRLVHLAEAPLAQTLFETVSTAYDTSDEGILMGQGLPVALIRPPS